MAVETETLCEIWKEEVLPAQTPSQLYDLAPIGIGTPLVESLTSYISRLAAAHSVLPRTLVTEIILPSLERSHLYHDGYPVYDHLTTFWKHSSVLNGPSGTAGNWVQTLKQLTQCNELHSLTFLSFTNTISCRNLTRPTQAWCSLCYVEWRKTNQIIYQPLLWHFSAVTVCPRHQQQLYTKCPYCERTFPPLTSCAQPGYCSHCQSWLGISPNRESKQKHMYEEKQYWVSATVGNLLTEIPTLTKLPSPRTLPMIITTHVNSVLDGNYSLFARQLQVHRRTAWEWGQGTQIPQLNMLLKLSSYFAISPIGLLMGNIPDINLHQTQTIEKISMQKEMPKRYRPFKSNKIRSVLESILQEITDPPPSLREVAKQLQYDASHLYKHFPDLCSAISSRYLTYQKEQRQHRLQQSYTLLLQTAQVLLAQRNPLSEREIGKRLPSRGLFKEKEIRMYFRHLKSVLKRDSHKEI